MNETPIAITLSSGYSVKAAAGSYVVQYWADGKWNNLAVFPRTEEGYEMAILVSTHLKENASIAELHE